MDKDTQMGFLVSRKQAYTQVFDGPVGQKVLTDLAHFCRATQSTFTADERQSLILEGRREVWLRIQQHLKLTEDQLWDLVTKGSY